MAKYTYTDNNGIVFTNLDSSPNPKLSVPGKLVSNQNDFEYADEDGIKPLVNAVEIDWNGADLSSIPTDQETPSEINTTADLLKAIKYASEVGGTTEVGEQGLSHKFN